MKSPRWSLRVIKNLAASGAVEVLETRAAEFFEGGRDEAYDAAIAAVAALTAKNFSHTVSQADECDVYGIVRDGAGWYLKVTVMQPKNATLIVISLHPLEWPLRTNGGMVNP